MKVTLKAADLVLGTADWDSLPVVDAIIQLKTMNGQLTQTRSVDKIEDDPANPRHIVTVWGAGYRFDGDLTHDPTE